MARLDSALLAIWPQVRQGSLGAVDRFVKLQHQRAQLLGLYAPTRIDVSDWRGELEKYGVDASELFDRLVAEIAAAYPGCDDERGGPGGGAAVGDRP